MDLLRNIKDNKGSDTDLILAKIRRVEKETDELERQSKKEKVLNDLISVKDLNKYMDILARIPLSDLQARDLDLIKCDLKDILDNDSWVLKKEDIYFFGVFIICSLIMIIVPNVREYLLIRILYFLNLGDNVATVIKTVKGCWKCQNERKKHELMIKKFWEVVDNERIGEMGITKEIKWSLKDSTVIRKEIELLISEIKQDILLLDFAKGNLYERKIREIAGCMDGEKKYLLQSLKIEVEFDILKENSVGFAQRLEMFLSNFQGNSLANLYQVYGYFSSLLQSDDQGRKQIILNSFASYFWLLVKNMRTEEVGEAMKMIMYDIRFLKVVTEYGLGLVDISYLQVNEHNYLDILRMIIGELNELKR